MKHKIISKYGVTKYVIKSGKEQMLDEVAVQSLRNRQVSVLLPVEVHQKRKIFQLIYDVTGLTSFSDFMKTPITKAVFVNIIREILHVFTTVQDNHMEIGKVKFDTDSIFVNPARNTLFFIYIPLRNYNNEIRLKDLLLSIPSRCIFSAGENRDYVSQFLQFINTQSSISKLDLAGFLNYLESGQQSVQGQEAYNGSLRQMERRADNADSQTYDPFRQDRQERKHYGRTGQASDGQETVQRVPFENRQKERSGINATSVLGDNSLYADGNRSAQRREFPYLVRQYTGEKIWIQRTPFRIGKDKGQCDYYVPDNSAVSRNHADIIIENDRYYIRDNGSTNFTYVNGRRIEQMTKYEITNDTQLRLANEDFTFYEIEGEMS